MSNPAAVHPFEKAGLGKAPFHCTGITTRVYQSCPGAPVQPGGCCAYCGTGIKDCFIIKSADGKRFEVGCDCVVKTHRACAGTDAERAARKIVDDVNKLKTKASNARKDVRIAAAVEIFEAHRAELSLMWHAAPPVFFAKTVAEHVDWMLRNAGRAGKIKIAQYIETIANEKGW